MGSKTPGDGLTGPEPSSSSSQPSHGHHGPDKSTPDGPGEHADHHPEQDYTLRRHNSLSLIKENDRKALHRLARTHSRARTETGAFVQAPSTEAAADPALDPSSPSFDLVTWLKHIVTELRKEGIVLPRTGIAFKNLTVSGTGDALQLQQTVGSWLLAPLRFAEHLRFGKKRHKKILNGFDGHVRSGELLVVLGRPGSGCSTLLKAMTGQLHGLHLSDDSHIDYNGVPRYMMMKEFKGEAIYNQEVRCFLGGGWVSRY